jgi:hypothetical protein
MSERVKWIEYRGKKILFCDFSNHDEQQYLVGVEEMETELLKLKPDTVWPQIVDVTNSTMTKVTSDRGKKTVALLSEANIKTRTAMVGVTGIKRVIAQAISKDVYFAKNMDDAKEWAIAE